MFSKCKLLAFVALLVFSFSTQLFTPNADALSGSDFQAGRIIDDSVFFDGTSMETDGIQAFLNSKVPTCDTNGSLAHGGSTRAEYGTSRGYPPPYNCLRNYSQDTPSKPAETGLCNSYGGGIKSAAQIIRDVAHDCGVSPKVLIVLLEKEQSLVTDDWPWTIQYRSATGYGCPDTAPCDAEYYGFFNQVYNAARQFKKYSRDSTSFRYRSGRENYIQYNPNINCGGTNLFLQNQATAGLYNYTPYQPNPSALSNLYATGDGCGAYGNRNFWRIFNDWFGSPVGSHCFYSPPATSVTGITFRKYTQPRVDQANLIIYSGSSTNCIESHTWNVGVSSWASNVATNHPIASLNQTNVQYADLNGDGVDEPILVGFNGTSSGFVEFHIWNNAMNKWQDHIISNIPSNAYTNGKISFSDVDGNGVDEAVLTLLSNTGSGKVEFHVLNNDMRSWKWHIASHLPTINQADGTVVFADVDGNGVDEPVLILYRNTGSGNVEFHTWNQGWWGWRFNTASNLTAVDPTNNLVVFADVDGNGVDEAVLVGLRGTGSGRVEFHTWNLGVTSWRYHTASNQSAL